MIALSIDFLAGRFHATPWDRSVNEGEVEWPPSPWRLLRAVVAAYFLRGENDMATLRRLCDHLAIAPRFVLPPSTPGHTRHYMPLDKAGKTGLVLDAFVSFDVRTDDDRRRDRYARAYVVWDEVTLSSDEHAMLARLVGSIPYLGRAESWCAIDVADMPVASDASMIAVDLASRSDETGTGPLVRRLGAGADLRGAGLLAALCETTDAMRKRRAVVPSGTTWLSYRFPADFGRDRVAAIRASRSADFPSRVLRFRLEEPAKGIALLPSVTETLVVAEVFRRAVLSVQGHRSAGQNTPLFTGKSADGKPLTGENHAYYLPRDRDGDGRIDTVDVYLPRTFSHEEYRAMTSVTELYDGSFTSGSQDASPFTDVPDPTEVNGQRRKRADAYLVTFMGDAPVPVSRRWRSATPFILPRFEKNCGSVDARSAESPEEQIRRELAHRALTDVAIAVDRGALARISLRGGRSVFAGTYRRVRRRDFKSDGPPREAVTATLMFEQPVRGPIAIGRYAHFGLGQFVPIDEDA